MSQLAVPSASAIGCCTKFNIDCLQDDITMLGEWSGLDLDLPDLGSQSFRFLGCMSWTCSQFDNLWISSTAAAAWQWTIVKL